MKPHRILHLAAWLFYGANATALSSSSHNPRRRVSLNTDWRFQHSKEIPDGVVYDHRPDTENQTLFVLKPWILPSANAYIQDPDKHHERPSNEPNITIPFVRSDFDDSDWETVRLPHDWAISGPFYQGDDPEIGPGMGRLPVQGVGWYRRQIEVSADELKKSIYLEVDGAMSYPIVWLNGHLVGGWPYGYNSWQLDLSPYVRQGSNQLAIRVENPAGDSSRWYPGSGIYRNVWLTTVDPTHVAHSGTFVSTKNVTKGKATIDIQVQIDSTDKRDIELVTDIFELDADQKTGKRVGQFPRQTATVSRKETLVASTSIKSPKLWGPPPSQSPNLYVAVTRLYHRQQLLDSYETRFGIRRLDLTGNGLIVNGEHVRIQGANQHHDLGALGAAFSTRAARRQLDLLRELGVNAIRTAHNPPAPELLEMTDGMGFLVLDEIFDSWVLNKTESDFHLIFPDWSEPDLRSFLRRDRNHPSVFAWSYGNEVAEQSSDIEAAAEISVYLRDILVTEDTTRLSTSSLNVANPNSSFAESLDIISLNYQGEGLRYGPAYAHLVGGNKKPPQYDPFHAEFPDKLLMGSEVAWSLSTRGTFLFPVTNYSSAPVNDTNGGGNSSTLEISGYELYSADAGSSPDRVIATEDSHPFVAGGFVWAGWDYVGEPYPYDDSRSSYSGIIDLAGFKKERFYLYQTWWRPDYPAAHIVPHWTWPDRVGQVTPVHVFSSADEAELFVNGVSQGRRQRRALEYRFRWDEVVYHPGEVHVVTYKDGKQWATDTVQTAGEAAGLRISADSDHLASDGEDLVFVTLEVIDDQGNVVPDADNLVHFSVDGPGEILATDNGFPADYTAFPSHDREAFHGLALAIVQADLGAVGGITVRAESDGIDGAEISLECRSV
ncbi:glycoside hydrolase superfamily [Aspergillus unguis]